MSLFQCIILITSVIIKVQAVPPSVCRADFRWDDCGKPPKAVMYYWKKGSRCEVGIWKGCMPNPNMFNDEYECVNTCVFQEKPVEREDPTDEPETETEAPSTESGNGTDVTNDTANGTDVTGATDAGNGTDATGSPDGSTESPDGTTGGGNDTSVSSSDTGSPDSTPDDTTAATEAPAP